MCCRFVFGSTFDFRLTHFLEEVKDKAIKNFKDPIYFPFRSEMFKLILVKFFVGFLFLNNACLIKTKTLDNARIFQVPERPSHDDEHRLRFEMEKEIKMNISWLSDDQIEVLHDLKEDMYNASELQKEVWTFYNFTKGFSRLVAAKHLLQYCENLVGNLLNNEKKKEWAILIKDLENYKPKIQVFEFLNEAINETEDNHSNLLFENGCAPFLEMESEMFFVKIVANRTKMQVLLNIILYLNVNNSPTMSSVGKTEKLAISLNPENAIKIYDKALSSDPNNTNILEKKGDALILLEKFEEGIKCYEKVMELNSTKKLVLQNKKINAMLKFAEQTYQNSMKSVFDIHFSSELRWLNHSQKREIRRLKAEGKKAPEILAKISEFYENSDAETKSTATDSMENGCIQVLYTIFGYEKAEELMESRLKNGTTQEFLDSLTDVGENRAIKAYLSGCQKFWFFDSETLPQVMVSLKINGKPVKLMYDTGASVTIGTKELWRTIGEPRLYSSSSIMGVGGEAKNLGRCRVFVEIDGKRKREWLYIIENGFGLFGRNWIKSFNIKIKH